MEKIGSVALKMSADTSAFDEALKRFVAAVEEFHNAMRALEEAQISVIAEMVAGDVGD
jgi:hypothetical protein